MVGCGLATFRGLATFGGGGVATFRIISSNDFTFWSSLLSRDRYFQKFAVQWYQNDNFMVLTLIKADTKYFSYNIFMSILHHYVKLQSVVHHLSNTLQKTSGSLVSHQFFLSAQ